MMLFEIHPFDGAYPIRFGMPRSQVNQILGDPDVSNVDSDNWSFKSDITIGYDDNNNVDNIAFGNRSNCELMFNKKVIRSSNQDSDPNPVFLELDRNPLERVGFLYFTKIGVATSGYHDNDPDQRVITMYPRGSKDKILSKAKKPISKFTKINDNLYVRT